MTIEEAGIAAWYEGFDFNGHYTPAQDLLCLRQLANEVDASRVIEVGCFVGQSTIALHPGRNDRAIYCVDTFAGPLDHQYIPASQNLGTFCKNMASLLHSHVHPCWGDSLEWSKTFHADFADLIFLDAAHGFEAVCRDIAAYFPALREGGLMVVHDAFILNSVNAAVQYCFGFKARVAQRDIQCPRVQVDGFGSVPTNLFVVQK